MSRLTRSEIETLIDDLIVAHPIYTPQLRALREQSLSQEAVRDEDDTGLFAAGHMQGFTMGLEEAKRIALAIDSGRGNEKEIAKAIEALKREPNAAGGAQMTDMELAEVFEDNWRVVAEFFASRNWPDTALGRAAADLNTKAPQIIAALRRGHERPPSDEMVMVPREPTQEMRDAGRRALLASSGGPTTQLLDAYRAMLYVAQQKEAK